MSLKEEFISIYKEKINREGADKMLEYLRSEEHTSELQSLL